MIDRGQIVSDEVRKSRVSLTHLAKELGISRNTLYNWFNEENLQISKIIAISKLIGVDLLSKCQIEVSDEIAQGADAMKLQFRLEKVLKENTALLAEVEAWKDKYYNTLEKYTKLLENPKQKP